MRVVFTIAIDRRFADELAAGVLAQYGGDPLALADVLILLPTRRSVRALREAFLRAADGKPTILPRMAPLGDVDESEWEVASGDGSALALPPAIEPRRARRAAGAAGRGLHRPRASRSPSRPRRPCRWRASSAACSTSSPSKASPSTGWKAWSRATSPATGSAP